MRFISAFAGIGGFDLALERVGMTCVGQIEKNPKRQEVLARWWPKVPRFDDIQTVKGSELGEAELVAAGWPCQDLSVAGKRAGIAGARSGLFFDLCRVIGEIQPAWIFLENVPGLLSQNQGRDFGIVLAELGELGYFVEWAILDAQFFGVPQRRRRVFLVGHLGGPSRFPILFESESGQGNLEASGETREGIAAFSAGQSAKSGGLGYQREQSPTLRGAESGTNQVPAIFGIIGGGDNGSGRDPNLVVQTLTSGSHSDDVSAPGRRNEDDFNLIVGSLQSHHGRLDSDSAGAGHFVPAIAKTLKSHGGNLKGREDHESYIAEGFIRGVRRLTPLECERLQGLPDGHTEGHSDSQRYSMIGDSVAVPVIEWIGKRIIELDRLKA